MLKKVFGRATAVAPDEAACLAICRAGVGKDVLAPFEGSSELPAGGDEEETTLLMRYLRAEKLDAVKALSRLQKQSAWRKGFGRVEEEDVAPELALGKVQLQLPTDESAGRPLLIIKGRLHRPGVAPQLMNNFIYFCLEASSHYCHHPANPDGKLVAVFDLSGLQIKNLDASALRASFAMLEQHFPERILDIWMLEAPTIFWGLWKLVSPFIDPSTRKRIHFVYGADGRKQLVESMGLEITPVEFGGTAAEVAVEAAVQQLPAWRQKHQLPPCLVSPTPKGQLRVSRSSPTLAHQAEVEACA
ncbi:hypothetical protein D9Q98_005746 [Chlorella vulgaris]|uniref:CRAL-TRIO domain-containing protein n=1 Tax=Chlorella vulgaris TaxID=3077 RepID=A0A9D4TMJ7_CHLVU|nr:hypothetical protein D9Q98_005746 [Chlorella vulgaris]